MKYTNLYKNINNPLDDQHVLEELLNAFAEDNDFYSALTKIHSKSKKYEINKTACDDLHAFLFNTWKKELLSITKEQYEQAIRDGLYKRDIFKLLEYLKTVPDVTTREEALQILNATHKDKALEEAMERYRWDTIGLYGSWTHINGRYVNCKKTMTPHIEHRLYINTNPKDVHEMSKIFLEKCMSKKLPYYFKIGEFNRRDDNIVIYSDTKNLPKYLEILKEIEKEHSELVSRCGRPPILTGLIHNWIGYGSEPLSKSGETSFNEVRANSIKKAISEELKAWYKKNSNATIEENGKKTPLFNYLCKKAINKKLKSLSNYLKSNSNRSSKYTEEDLKNSAFLARFEKEVMTQAPTIINNYLTGKNPSARMEIPVKAGANIYLYSSDIIKELERFITVINANDPNFINRVKQRIIKDAVTLGIDPNKYCFDQANIELLIKEEEASTKKPVQSTDKKPVQGQQIQYHRPVETPTLYKHITDSETLEARRKIEENTPSQQNFPTNQRTEKSKYHRPYGTTMSYKPMSNEEIRESQRKLAEVPMVKVKR